MVYVVIPLAVIAVEDAYGVHLLDLVILVADVYMLGYGLASAVKDTLQVVQLACELHLDDDQMALAVLGLDVNTVELVVVAVLVRFALQYLHNFHIVIEQH